MSYEAPVPLTEQASVSDRIQSFLQLPECVVPRLHKTPNRTIDVRAHVLELSCHHDRLRMRFRVTANGPARPDEVLEALRLGQLVPRGAVITRTQVELEA
jgi:hypothetical protein